ncbi:MAG: DUF2155 domain-containing protein [Hyphomicrobium sp.]
MNKKKLTNHQASYIFKPLLFLIYLCVFGSEVLAERLQNEVAVFTALDKVTANTKKLEVPINQTSEFGSLRVTPFICYTNPPTDTPNTTSFVQIEEVQLDGQLKKIFSGWMFAQSPGLNALEHPVFDIWLTDCEKPKKNPSEDGIFSSGPKGDRSEVLPNHSDKQGKKRDSFQP